MKKFSIITLFAFVLSIASCSKETLTPNPTVCYDMVPSWAFKNLGIMGRGVITDPSITEKHTYYGWSNNKLHHSCYSTTIPPAFVISDKVKDQIRISIRNKGYAVVGWTVAFPTMDMYLVNE